MDRPRRRDLGTGLRLSGELPSMLGQSHLRGCPTPGTGGARSCQPGRGRAGRARSRPRGYNRAAAAAGPAAAMALRCLLLLLCGAALGPAVHLDLAEHRSQAAKIKVNPRGNLWATGTGRGAQGRAGCAGHGDIRTVLWPPVRSPPLPPGEGMLAVPRWAGGGQGRREVTSSFIPGQQVQHLQQTDQCGIPGM